MLTCAKPMQATADSEDCTEQQVLVKSNYMEDWKTISHKLNKWMLHINYTYSNPIDV